MASINYINTRTQLSNPKVTSPIDLGMRPFGYLDTPIPAVGVVGSITLLPGGCQINTIKKGDKITIVPPSSSVRYEYTATEDAQATTAGNGLTVAVLPAMQINHGRYSSVWGPVPAFRRYSAINVIQALNPTDKRTYSLDAPFCVPYVEPWPWSADPNGVPWDKDNLLALSFVQQNSFGHRDSNIDLASFSNGSYGAGDFIPVPRILGSEYTKFTAKYFGTSGYAGLGGIGGSGRGYCGGKDAMASFRTDTGIKSRDVNTMPTSDPRWKQTAWHPRRPKFSTHVTGPSEGNTGILFQQSGSQGVLPWPGSSSGLEIAVVGSRGGYYSIKGYSGNGASHGGFTIRVYQEDPGYSTILLATIVVADGYNYPAPVTTGTWSAVVLPTVPGTVVKCYCVITPDIAGPISAVGLLFVAESTNVPWCHHVVTGNLVAPGGLIAPFY
jgi:hypothetical protein